MGTLVRLAHAWEASQPQPAALIAQRVFTRDSRYGWPGPVHGLSEFGKSAEYRELERQWLDLQSQLIEHCEQLRALWQRALSLDVAALVAEQGVAGAVDAQQADALQALQLEAEAEEIAAKMHTVRREAERLCGLGGAQ